MFCPVQRGATRVSPLVLGVLTVGLALLTPTTSRAQSSPSSSQASTPDTVQGRRATLRAARAVKNEQLGTLDQTALESVLLWIEDQQFLQQIGGVAGRWKQFRLGPAGLGDGAGLGLRVAYVPFYQRSDLDLRINVGGSTRGYWRIGGNIGYRLEPVFTYLYTQVQRRPQRTYYLNLKNTTGPDTPRRFDVTNWTSGGVLGVRLAPSLSLAASTSYLRHSAAVGTAATQPLAPGILNPATSTRYVTIGGSLQFDRRDVKYNEHFGNRYVPASDNLTDRPLNPESGTLFSLNARRFHEVTDVDADFHQLEAELQQYLSFYNGYHTFAFRHRTVLTGPEDATVPFYQLPYVGGDFTVRGYEPYRFRGAPHGVLYNLEYRYRVWHYADMVLFGDAGKVFDEAQQWGLTDLRYAYGAGLRFVTDRAALFRVGVAFNEEHTPRLVLEFSNVF